MDHFMSELHDQNLILQPTSTNSTEEAYSIFHKRFVSILNKHVPLKILSKQEIKVKQKSWSTIGILKVYQKLSEHYLLNIKILKTKKYS